MSAAIVDALVAQPPAVRRPRRITVGVGLCMAFVLMVLVLAVFGAWLAPSSPSAQDLGLGISRPSSEHWLGTDDLGRDVLSRLIVGARTAVVGPAIIAVAAMVIGSVLGLLAGYSGGWVDSLIMRWADLMYALPGLLVVIVVAGVLGGGYWLAVALLVVLSAPYDARIVRGATLEQRSRPYVEAARILGLSRSRIMARHIWPNVLALELANAFLTFAFALVTLASLSFLGLGVGPATADWGRMLAEGRTLLDENPAAALAPAAMLVLTAASVNILGDRLHEWLSDRGRAR
jgi:peptide/nickel transport system permease protein